MHRRSLLLAGLGATTAATTALTGAAPGPTTDRTEQSRNRNRGLPAAQQRQLTLLVQQYLADRAARVTAARPAPNRAAALSLTSDLLRDYRGDADRLDGVRDQAAALHSGYTRARTTAELTDVAVHGSTATARAVEHTALYFARNAPGSPASTRYRSAHQVIFNQVNGAWALAGCRYLPTNAYSRPLTQFPESIPESMRPRVVPNAVPQAGRRPAKADPSGRQPAAKSADGGYDYNAMISYAEKWWNDRNLLAYPVYDDDCTNFISQCLVTGGWLTEGSWPDDPRDDNSYWYCYGFFYNTSYTWAGAENFFVYATQDSKRTTVLDNAYDLTPSDILQYNFSHAPNDIQHTQICTGWNESPLMTQHTDDYADRPLSEILADPANGSAWLYPQQT